MAGKIDRDQFVALLTERFPEVAAEIVHWHGLLHLEMAVLGRATQAAIDAHDRDTVRRHFIFVDEIVRDATAEVENAVNVSYLEHLRFVGRKAGPAKARELLAPRLAQALTELEEYLDQLFKSRRGKN